MTYFILLIFKYSCFNVIFVTIDCISCTSRQKQHLLVHLLSCGSKTCLEFASKEKQSDHHPFCFHNHLLDHHYSQNLDFKTATVQNCTSCTKHHQHPKTCFRKAEFGQPGKHPRLKFNIVFLLSSIFEEHSRHSSFYMFFMLEHEHLLSGIIRNLL